MKGHFAKDRFSIDLDTWTVTCPAGVTAIIRTVNHQRHTGVAEFKAACSHCPLRARCTTAKDGRRITIGHHEARLAAGRARQADPVWRSTTGPPDRKSSASSDTSCDAATVAAAPASEGSPKTAADFSLLAAAVNLARLAKLGLTRTPGQRVAITP